MLILRNFVKKIRLEDPEFPLYVDDTGKDWFEWQDSFQEDTLKIAFDSTGQVRGAGTDITRFSPEGLSIAELDINAAPVNFEAHPDWYFDGEKLYIPLRIKEARATQERNYFLTATDAMMIEDFSIGDEELDEEQRDDVRQVRKAYRQWPSQPGWPLIPKPPVPEWIMSILVKRNYDIDHSAWPPSIYVKY